MENRELAEQAAVSWIARRETGPWSQEDAAEFEAWLSASPTRQIAYYRFNNTWREVGRLKALGMQQSPDRPLSAAFDDQSSGPVRTVRTGFMRYAIAACVVLSVASTLFFFRDAVFGLNSYRTAVGGLAAIPLSDGSRVTLNTDSQLRVTINDKERRIDLERGEAFFEIVKDRNRPFIVMAGERRIVVVGTQFSVRREREDVRVSVAEGAVRLIASPAQVIERLDTDRAAASGAKGLLLTAGAVARAANTGVSVQQAALVDIEQQLTWRTGILTFRETPLVDAVAEFNRYNERKLFIEDPAIAAVKVGGIFRSTDLDPFLRLIQDGLALKVTQDENHILLSTR